MTKAELKRHKIAAKKLEVVKDRAFALIKRKLGRVSEYNVNQFILSEFKRQELVMDKNRPSQIVAVAENTSFVHYFPQKEKSKVIKKDNLILLDIWARLKEKDSPFADITWMAYTGRNIPKEIEKTFKTVIGAREAVLEFIRKNLKEKKLNKTKIIDKATRDYFKKFALDKYFLHGLGHSLSFEDCHGKYFRFGRKTESKLQLNIPFTIEPGLYFKDEFGIRSEIDCYVNEDYKLFITTGVQNKISKI